MARVLGGAALRPFLVRLRTRISKGCRAVAEDHDPTDRGQPGSHVGKGGKVVGVDGEERCAGVVDDGGHLRRRQTPVDRDVHRSHERAAEEEVEIRNPVAVEKGQAVAGCEPIALRCGCHAARGSELFGPSATLRPLDQHLVVRLVARQMPQQSSHGVAVLFGDDDARSHPCPPPSRLFWNGTLPGSHRRNGACRRRPERSESLAR